MAVKVPQQQGRRSRRPRDEQPRDKPPEAGPYQTFAVVGVVVKPTTHGGAASVRRVRSLGDDGLQELGERARVAEAAAAALAREVAEARAKADQLRDDKRASEERARAAEAKAETVERDAASALIRDKRRIEGARKGGKNRKGKGKAWVLALVRDLHRRSRKAVNIPTAESGAWDIDGWLIWRDANTSDGGDVHAKSAAENDNVESVTLRHVNNMLRKFQEPC